ncbi:MAG: Bor/Iss family lipoprotein [Gemmatimonadales bacterium]
MRRITRSLLGRGLVVLFSACYHATIETGLPPGNQTLERPWALSFIAGLVPPPVVETAERCPNGVSKVETQLSFLNQVVNVLTFGILTPMDIRVTCAARGGMDVDVEAASIDQNLSMQQKRELLTELVRQSAESGTPVWVEFQ